MKKFLLIVVLLWIAFLAFLIFREKISHFLSSTETAEQVSVTQTEEVEPPEVVVEPKIVKEKPVELTEVTVIPFAPLEPLPGKPSVGEEMEKTEEVSDKKVTPKVDPRDMIIADYDKDPFGLICTKFSRLPSRFRLQSWDGTKKVVLEDLENYDHGTKSFPRHTLSVNVPYKELKHAVTDKSKFVPCKASDRNKRLQVLSLNIKHEALSFSAGKKPIAFAVLRDYKLGGSPYQITNEMEKPLASAYDIEVEQFNGPQKFFHDLTGKPRNHTFGGWGFEYKLIGQNNSDRTLTIQRKELKTGKITRKDISWDVDVP